MRVLIMFNPIRAFRELRKLQRDLSRMADELHVYVSSPPPTPWVWPDDNLSSAERADIQKALKAHRKMMNMQAPELDLD
jgi:hypothetical protein